MNALSPSRFPRGAAGQGRAGNGDPLAVSDLFDVIPACLSHHPDQDDPQPVESQRPSGEQ